MDKAFEYQKIRKWKSLAFLHRYPPIKENSPHLTILVDAEIM
jgi:hypothetical protein